MIRHCVFVNYRPEITAAERAKIVADLTALRPKLPGMHEVQAGRNVSPEGLGKGFADGFVIDFDTAAARDAYLEHPEHKAVGARIVAGAAGGSAGLLVFDFDLA
jgi:hypothetical protein